jgi:hypothetical protein
MSFHFRRYGTCRVGAYLVYQVRGLRNVTDMQHRSNAIRYEDVENMAQTWPYHPTRMPEPHDTDRIWDSYDSRRASSPKVSTRHDPRVLHDVSQSRPMKESPAGHLNAGRTPIRQSRPNQTVHSVRLEDEYRHLPHVYDFA